jgi:hypothetical protein
MAAAINQYRTCLLAETHAAQRSGHVRPSSRPGEGRMVKLHVPRRQCGTMVAGCQNNLNFKKHGLSGSRVLGAISMGGLSSISRLA